MTRKKNLSSQGQGNVISFTRNKYSDKEEKAQKSGTRKKSLAVTRKKKLNSDKEEKAISDKEKARKK